MKITKEIREVNQIAENMVDNNTPITATTVLEFLKAFAPLAIPILTFVKIFTSEKADSKIDEVIAYLKGLQ